MLHRLREHVEFLAHHPRPAASEWHARSRAYIHEQLTSAGFKSVEVNDRAPEFPVINLLTEPVPADPGLPLVIVGAHYDSIPGSPGADDNASAVAALLEIARILGPRFHNSDTTFTARLQLAAYDLEEAGLIGSGHHADSLRRGNAIIKGMIALEMLGYTDHRPRSQGMPPMLAGRYPDVGNFIGVVSNEASVKLHETLLAGLRSVDGLPVEGLIAPGSGHVLPEVRLSDHASFWDHEYPAIMITDTSFYRNPHYHEATDTPETLDYEFLAKVTQGVAEGVWRLLTSDG